MNPKHVARFTLSGVSPPSWAPTHVDVSAFFGTAKACPLPLESGFAHEPSQGCEHARCDRPQANRPCTHDSGYRMSTMTAHRYAAALRQQPWSKAYSFFPHSGCLRLNEIRPTAHRPLTVTVTVKLPEFVETSKMKLMFFDVYCFCKSLLGSALWDNAFACGTLRKNVIFACKSVGLRPTVVRIHLSPPSTIKTHSLS